MLSTRTPWRPLFRVVQQYWASKPGNDELDWEDAMAVSPEQGLAIVADGASAGIFSRQWATILVEAFARQCPDPSWSTWHQDCVCTWKRTIETRCPLRPLQIRKMAEVGAGAAMVGLRIDPPHPSRRKQNRWRAWAIGDCSMFLIRDDRLGTSFPFKKIEEFPHRPELITTRSIGLPRMVSYSGCYRPGDVFLLASDAIARWLLRHGQDRPDIWKQLLHWSPAEWMAQCTEAIARAELGIDDYTAVVLQASPTSVGDR